MEEYDDLVSAPDQDGKLELTYRGWNLVDDVVWTMGRELLYLDVSFNSVTEFPPELGDLILLRELNCASNKVGSFPKQIGKLKNLQVLKANGNKLTQLPEEIGQCTNLAKINLGENQLQSVPVGLAKLPQLSELILCNNRLKKLPPSLCLCPSLSLVDVGNNPDLKHMVPMKLQSNTHFILWMCRKWCGHAEESALVKIVNKEYETLIERARDGSVEVINKVERLHDERRKVAELFPRGLDFECMKCYSCVCVKTGIHKNLSQCAIM